MTDETTAHLSVAKATTEDAIIAVEKISASTTAAGARFYFQLFVVIIGVIGTAANGLVLYALVASKQHKKHLLIVHQNVLDLSACISLSISYAVKLFNIYLAGSTGYWLCMLLINDNIIRLLSHCSIINLAIISVERYFKVIHPVWSKKNLRPWMIYSAMAFDWISPVVDKVVVVAFSKITVMNGHCFDALLTKNKSHILLYTLWYFLSCYAIILLIFIFCYGRILVAVRRQARVMAGHSAAGSSTAPQAQSSKIQTNIIKTMIYVCAFYAILWLPNHIAFVLFRLLPNVVKHNTVVSYYGVLFLAFLYMSANPLIYAIMCDPVRKVIIRMIYCNKASQQANDTDSAPRMGALPMRTLRS